ncbi:hypothetical protein D0Z00_003827 [Geotrichum galactomycetum]|uniref:Uncharacterized protein n=1 Tax=Geotrichum galactomycetum TaxID=27317 RepID=A0ACB6V080_9ASCO|nr:hypothetical protein D0Z00_003827 [Geotrichum candidum]
MPVPTAHYTSPELTHTIEPSPTFVMPDSAGDKDAVVPPNPDTVLGKLRADTINLQAQINTFLTEQLNKTK